jgi:hypothetical protein
MCKTILWCRALQWVHLGKVWVHLGKSIYVPPNHQKTRSQTDRHSTPSAASSIEHITPTYTHHSHTHTHTHTHTHSHIPFIYIYIMSEESFSVKRKPSKSIPEGATWQAYVDYLTNGIHS